MDITKLSINLPAITKDKPAIVTAINPIKNYKDGRYTDEVVGFRVEAVATGNGYEKFSVNVLEQPNILENELGTVAVTFEKFEAKIYKDYKNNRYDISCKAQRVVIIDNF